MRRSGGMAEAMQVATTLADSGRNVFQVNYLAAPKRLWQKLRSVSPASLSREAGERWSSRLARGVSVLALVLIAAEMADLTWALLPESAEAPAEVAGRTGPKTSVTDSALDIASVVQAHLFGRTGQVVRETPRTLDAPETTLNLVLVGVYFAPDIQEALAIIAPGGGDHQVYGVGDALPGGATVQEIQVDRVFLKRSGRLEVLKLVKDGKLVSNAKSGTRPSSRAAQGPSRRVDYRSNRQLARTLGQYQKQLRQDPMSLSNLARVQPVREGNQLIGYKLSAGKDPRLLSRFGLRPGDVLVSVNGIDLSGPEKMATVAEELANAQGVDLEVLRGRAKLAFSFKVGL